MKPTSPIVRAPIASATRRLREQGMPPEEVEAVLDVDEAQVLHRYMELHRERLDERLAAERRALEGVERSLALAILQRIGQAASGEVRHAAQRKEVHMTEHDVQGNGIGFPEKRHFEIDIPEKDWPVPTFIPIPEQEPAPVEPELEPAMVP